MPCSELKYARHPQSRQVTDNGRRRNVTNLRVIFLRLVLRIFLFMQVSRDLGVYRVSRPINLTGARPTGSGIPPVQVHVTNQRLEIHSDVIVENIQLAINVMMELEANIAPLIGQLKLDEELDKLFKSMPEF